MNRLANSIVRENLLGEKAKIYIEGIHDQMPKLTNIIFFYVFENQFDHLKLYLPVKRMGAFNRIEFAHEYHLLKNNQWERITKVSTFIDLLTDNFYMSITKELKKELLNSRNNLVASFEALNGKKRWMKQQIQTTFHFYQLETPTTWLQWIEQIKKVRIFDELTYSESMVVEGHPLHPSTKTKLGLTDEEVKQYAPEFEHDIPLLIVLVKKSLVNETRSRSWESQSLFGLLPSMEETSKEIVQSMGQPLNEYSPFIVHPWQYEKVLPELYSNEFSKSDIIAVPYKVPSKATLSFRTMNLLELDYHVKLPIRVQATSAVRTVSPEITVDGPLLSDLFNEISLQDKYKLRQLIILKEPYGAFINSKHDDEKQTKGRNLAFILREKPNVHLKEGETGFVAASLTAENPYSQDPIIIELIKEYFNEDKITLEMALDYMKHYATCLLAPLIHLLQKYGIALEGHMQNTIVCIKNGQIHRMMIRDLGGIRIHKETLQSRFPNFQVKNTSVLTENIKDVSRKFHHAVIQNHLGELVFVLSGYLAIGELKFWGLISGIIEDSLDKELVNFPLTYSELFSKNIETKSLLSMRIHNQAKTYLFSSFQNPLLKGEEQ